MISALYNIVDQVFIGNSELGYPGNAATGVSFPIICIANAFAWCLWRRWRCRWQRRRCFSLSRNGLFRSSARAMKRAAYYHSISGQRRGDVHH